MKKLRLKRVLSMFLALVLTISVALPNELSVVSAVDDYRLGEATDTISGNIMKNPEFEENNFATSGTPYFQWYPNGSTLSQDSEHKNAGEYSMKVSGRTAHWHRAEYREWFGNLAFDKEYYLQGAVSASQAANIQMYVQVTGYGGPAENAYPSVTLSFDSASVAADEWAILSGTFKVTSAPSATEGKIDVTVHFGDTTQVIQAVTGLDNINIFVQEAYHANTTDLADLYLDSFLLQEYVEESEDTEEVETIATLANKIEGNLINNPEFDTDEYEPTSTSTIDDKWYPYSSTLEKDSSYSYASGNSLKVTNRNKYSSRANYRVSGNLIELDKDYLIQGKVSASTATEVEFYVQLICYGGVTSSYPSYTYKSDPIAVEGRAWETVSTNMRLTSATSETDGKVDITVQFGDTTEVIKAVSGVAVAFIFVQEKAHSNTTNLPDLYYDNFSFAPAPILADAIEGNLINNPEFDTDEYEPTSTSTINDKWYPYSSTLEKDSSYSYASGNSLKVTNRNKYSSRANYRVSGNLIEFDKDYLIQGKVSASAATEVEYYVQLICYGGVTSSYPSYTFKSDPIAVESGAWETVSTNMKLTSATSETDGKVDITVQFGDTTEVIEAVSGVAVAFIFVQEKAHSNTTNLPDLYYDNFSFAPIEDSSDDTGDAEQDEYAGVETDTIEGNLFNNPEFDTDDFEPTSTATVNAKWYPYNSTLERDTSYYNLSENSLKVTNRKAFSGRANYRIPGSSLNYDEDYLIQGKVSSSAATEVEFYVQVICSGGVSSPYPSYTYKSDPIAVENGSWETVATNMKLSSAASATEGKVDITVDLGGNTEVIEAVSGVAVVFVFVQEKTHSNTTNLPDLYYDSFLCVSQSENDSEDETNEYEGVETDTIDGNLFNNPEFDTDDFEPTSTATIKEKWYPYNSTLERDTSYYNLSGNSLKVTNRKAFSGRANYRIPGSSITFGEDYLIQGAVSASAATEVEFYVQVICEGGVSSPYPSYTYKSNPVAVENGSWETISTNLKLTSSASEIEGKVNISVELGGTTKVIESVSGVAVVFVFVQEKTHSNTANLPDLYYDSFLCVSQSEGEGEEIEKVYPTGHVNASNTEEAKQNLIYNSSFETNDFVEGSNYGKWYKSTGSQVELIQYNGASHSGNNSLRVTNRNYYWDAAKYRVTGENIFYGKEYNISGYVSTETNTNAELSIQVHAYGGENTYYPATQKIVLDTKQTSIADWSKLEGTVKITREPNTVDSDKWDIIISCGDQTEVIERVAGIAALEIFVQEEYHTNSTCPDMYLDSFMMENISPAPSLLTGHTNAANTENIKYNIIKNSSFETDDFAKDLVSGKWYTISENVSLIQDKQYSHSGKASLRVTGREDYWNRAEYRVEGSDIKLGHTYEISGYISFAEATSYGIVPATDADLYFNVWGYGGPESNPYPNQLIYADLTTVSAGEWAKLSASFTITAEETSDPGYYDMTIYMNGSGDTYKLEHVQGISVIEIIPQEAYNPVVPRQDLYLDSFSMVDITSSDAIEKPTGHTGATDTSANKKNLINNAGFEKNEYSSELTSGKWYADPSSVSLKSDTTFSHSGKASLLVSNREEHWHRAAYQISAEKLALGHTYALSGYISATEDVNAELMVEIFGYTGSEENREYVSQLLTFDTANVTSGKWSKLSGEFTITQKETAKEGIYDLVISWSGGEDVVIKNVNGLSAVRIMPQEAYNAATPRADLYLDSFLLEDITPAPEAPTGHSNQENTELLSDNLIKNGSFEKSDFVLEEYVLDKWYTMEGCPATLTQDSTFSHSGKASLKVSGREEFWHRAEYRVEGSNFIMGDSYEVSGYVSALEDTNVEMLLQVYAFGGPESNPYPSQLLTVDADAVKAGEWTKLSAVFKITAKKNSEEGYYDYTITMEGNNNSYIISHVKGISLVQLMVQEAYSEVTPRTDLYLDSFMMRNQTKHNMPIPTGHTGAANTEDVLENMINNSSFESDLYEDEPNIGLWFTNGGNYDVEQTAKYSHSGEYSTRIYNRKAANHTLMYRVEGANIELGTEYTLSGYVAAALKTDVELVITVYGYAGDENNRTYPSQTIVLDRESVKNWTELLGGFMIQMEEGHLYVTTANGKVDVGQCLGLSNVEIYVLTDETVENYTTDLYLDTFSLIAGAATTKDTGNAEDILVSDFMEKKEDESALAKFMKAVEEFANNHTTAYVILIAVGLIIILGSVVIVIRSKRRKS